MSKKPPVKIKTGGIEIGHLTIPEHINAQGTGDFGPTLEYQDRQ